MLLPARTQPVHRVKESRMPRKAAAPPEEGSPAPEAPLPPELEPTPAAKGPGLKGIFSSPRFWPVVSGVLVILVIVGGLFAFVTISDKDKNLTDARASLAAESSRGVALSDCIADLQADETSLTAVYDDLKAVNERLWDGGDWDDARVEYEKTLKKASEDFAAAWVDILAQDQGQFLIDFANATSELDDAEGLAAELSDVTDSVDSDLSDALKAFNSLKKDMAETEKTCAAALGDGASPSASASAEPSATED
jgi:hypothetical protein